MSEPLFEDWSAASDVDSFSLADVQPEPEPIVFQTPDYIVERGQSLGQSKLDAGPPLTMRDKLKAMAKGKKDTTPPRNVKKTVKEPIPNKPGQFIEPLTDFYNFVALAAMPFDPELTMVITGPCRAVKEDEDPNTVPSVADNCARTLDEAAQRSESLRRVLATFTTASVWGAVIAAHVPILAVVAKNHTPLGERADPARAMEAMLKRQAESQG